MKQFIFYLSIFFGVPVTAQSVDEIMSKATCNCIEHILNPSSENGKLFNTCFLKSVGKDTTFLKNEYLNKYGDTTSESASKFGIEYFQRNSVTLVYSCDNYFNILDTSRLSAINSLNKDSIRNNIALMNKSDSTLWNKEFYVARGLYYFALKDYALSLRDLDASLAIDSLTTQSLFFKAFIFEIEKQYDQAIKLYTKLAEITNTNDYNVYAAIAKRKKNRL